MKRERISFAGHDGAELAARLDRPAGPVRGAALMAHCFTCTKDIAAARRIAARLTAHGMAVLRFDFTGLGHSGGEFANTDFTSNVGDLRAAAAWMAENALAPQLLIGHSLGGAAAVAAAPDIEGLRALVTIGAPADPEHVLKNFGASLADIEAQGAARVSLGGREFEIRRGFVEDVRAASLESALRRMKAALLVLHAPRDEIVGIDNAQALFVAARHPKSFVTLDDADHLISRAADADYTADVIMAWASRYLALEAEPAPEGAPEGVVRVSEADPKGFRQDIMVGGDHFLSADEPESVGGTNAGPSPYQLLSAALGACTTMTLRLYARHKKLPLERVRCDVTHNKRHADEGEDAESGEGGGEKVDVFERVIHVEGNLDEATRKRLVEIADRCPVHRSLHRRATINTRLG